MDSNISLSNKVLVFAKAQGYKINKDGLPISKTGKLLCTNKNKKGYERFTIRAFEGLKSVLVHKLQAYQKFGDKLFEKGVVVRHLNGDSTDNSWDNIGIGTHSENMMDKPKEMRIAQALIAGLSNSPLSEEDVLEIRQRVESKNYETYQKLAEEYGLKSKGSISGIINKKTWTHV